MIQARFLDRTTRTEHIVLDDPPGVPHEMPGNHRSVDARVDPHRRAGGGIHQGRGKGGAMSPADPVLGAFERQVEAARRCGCSAEGHGAVVEAVAQVGDRLASIEAAVHAMPDAVADRVAAARSRRVQATLDGLRAWRWPAGLSGSIVGGLAALQITDAGRAVLRALAHLIGGGGA